MSTRILLVDDDEDIRLVARMALETLGHCQVLTCSSGQEALAALEEFEPDLVLLDVEMPGMDGPAVLARMRQDQQLAPVVFLTARLRPADVARYRELGAIDVIAKPFDPMMLSRQVQAIRDRR